MTIDEMLEQRLLESVPVDQATAAEWLADAGRHIEAASRILDVDLTGAFALSYDAGRKACAALLLGAGLRARAVPGSHRSVIEAAAELVDTDGDKGLIRRLDRVRRDRNQAEYGSRSFSRGEVESVIELARSVVATARAPRQA